MAVAINLAGGRFGRWTVLARHPENYRRTFAQWRCRCDCGTERVVLGNSLRTGRSKDCGCGRNTRLGAARHKHGAARSGAETRAYNAWKHLIQRCENPDNKDYASYGGRGITVCPEWRADFRRFLADMGEPPAGRSIDRIDVDGNYEPGNCRWATAYQQTHNRRCSPSSHRASGLARYGAERLLLAGSSHDPNRVGDVAQAGGVAASGHPPLTSSPSATEVPE